MFVNKLFAYFTCAYSKSNKCFNVKYSAYYIHKKTKIFTDFQICISVPLKRNFTGKRIRTDWGILIEKTKNK